MNFHVKSVTDFARERGIETFKSKVTRPMHIIQRDDLSFSSPNRAMSADQFVFSIVTFSEGAEDIPKRFF